uniref:Uncharacterized protein n=1 Tax=Solanum lycopersicum TaxID=4081 RepID=A0A3Q7G425_SOLLC
MGQQCNTQDFRQKSLTFTMYGGGRTSGVPSNLKNMYPCSSLALSICWVRSSIYQYLRLEIILLTVHPGVESTFMTSKVVSDNSRRLKTEISPGSLDNKHGVGSSLPFGAEKHAKSK